MSDTGLQSHITYPFGTGDHPEPEPDTVPEPEPEPGNHHGDETETEHRRRVERERKAAQRARKQTGEPGTSRTGGRPRKGLVSGTDPTGLMIAAEVALFDTPTFTVAARMFTVPAPENGLWATPGNVDVAVAIADRIIAARQPESTTREGVSKLLGLRPLEGWELGAEIAAFDDQPGAAFTQVLAAVTATEPPRTGDRKTRTAWAVPLVTGFDETTWESLERIARLLDVR